MKQFKLIKTNLKPFWDFTQITNEIILKEVHTISMYALWDIESIYNRFSLEDAKILESYLIIYYANQFKVDKESINMVDISFVCYIAITENNDAYPFFTFKCEDAFDKVTELLQFIFEICEINNALEINDSLNKNN